MPRNQTSAATAWGNPNCFYILHVEDEEPTASIDRDGRYESVFKKPIEDSLRYYGVAPKDICWDLARSVDEADAKITAARRSRPMRPYDTVICDLAIPKIHSDEENGAGESDRTVNWQNGFEVLRWLTKGKYHGSAQSVIVVSAWAKEDHILAAAEAEAKKEHIRFDDWILKTGESEAQDPETLIAKFRRCLIPTEKFVRLCRTQLNPPSLFVSEKMKRLLRSLIFIAGKDYSPERPLAKILVLGEPGSGKGMLARTFYGLLRLLDQERAKIGQIQSNKGATPILDEVKKDEAEGQVLEEDRWRRPFRVRNCAQFVADGGHGGRISLFGARSFQNLDDSPGVFEDCSSYEKKVQANDADKKPMPSVYLADYDAKPDSNRAGVVFLDEFADMSPVLQASVLNALEDGVVVREGGSHRPIRIGCHVVCATNFDPWNSTDEDSRDLRPDLLDRIPYILRMPTLRERPEEIRPIVEALATYRAGKAVSLSDSALRLLEKCVSPERAEDALITSVRQLQMIADVLDGESLITDSNLTALFEKAKIYQKEDVLFSERDYNALLTHVRTLYEQLCKERIVLPTVDGSEESATRLDEQLVDAIRELMVCEEAIKADVTQWMQEPQVSIVTSEVMPTTPSLMKRWRYIFAIGLISACKSKTGGLKWANVDSLFGETTTRIQNQLKKELQSMFADFGITVAWKTVGSEGGLAHLVEFFKDPNGYSSTATSAKGKQLSKSTFEFDDSNDNVSGFLSHFGRLLQKQGM